MNLDTLLYEVEGGVATITLNRPERHNAFNQAMANELQQVWTEVKRDPEVVCVILTAAGEKSFCTGMDVSDVATGDARGTGTLDRKSAPWFQLTAIQNQCWKPVVTAVNGMVNGGGLHFIADADLIVCAEHATFFDTHVKVGFISGIEPVGLARRIPLEQVLRLALLGGSERMDAQTAKQIGLVGEVVPQAELMPRARALAEMISQHSPTALALSKKAIWQSLDTGLDAGIDNAWELIQKHTQHPDLMEGATAFVEKRKPRWAGYTEMSYEAILFDVSDGIATITLNRPDKFNAYTPQMGVEIVDAFECIRDDDSARVVILTGAGKGFCGGVDLEVLKQSQSGSGESSGSGPALGTEAFINSFPLDLLRFPKPVIAAINGAAIGVGVTMTLPCDLRIAAEGAKLGLTFAKLGILPGLGSTHLLPRLVGIANANDLVLSARIVLADEAARMGLVNRVVPKDALMAEVRELAAGMAALAPEVLTHAKAALQYGADSSIGEAMKNEAAASVSLRKGKSA